MTQLNGAARLKQAGDTPSVEEVIALLKPIVVAVLAKPAAFERIDENASMMEEGLGLDSVMIIEVIGAIEKRLDFQFDDEDLSTRSFASLRTLATVIVERLRNPADEE